MYVLWGKGGGLIYPRTKFFGKEVACCIMTYLFARYNLLKIFWGALPICHIPFFKLLVISFWVGHTK